MRGYPGVDNYANMVRFGGEPSGGSMGFSPFSSGGMQPSGLMNSTMPTTGASSVSSSSYTPMSFTPWTPFSIGGGWGGWNGNAGAMTGYSPFQQLQQAFSAPLAPYPNVAAPSLYGVLPPFVDAPATAPTSPAATAPATAAQPVDVGLSGGVGSYGGR